MKFGKKIRSIMCLFATFIFVVVFSCSNVKAAYYDPSLNGVNENSIEVSRRNGTLKFTINYQNGISGVEAYICESTNKCMTTGYKTKFVDLEIDTIEEALINPSEQVVSYDAEFSDPYDDHGKSERLESYVDKHNAEGKIDNRYHLYIKANFCITRLEDKSGCLTWDKNAYIYHVEFDLESGITSDGTLNETLEKFLTIVNNYVIPIMWVAMGVLLIVRGIMLGMDIVKSADESEVRAKKISGLVWLFIGVGVGYAVTIAAHIVMDMFGFGGLF